VTKNERAAIKADGFVNYYHSPAAVRPNREGLRGAIESLEARRYQTRPVK
jgi:hypothetical protein